MLKKFVIVAIGSLLLTFLPISIPQGEPAFASIDSPIMGSSQLSGAQIAQWYRAKKGNTWALTNISLNDLANLYISEGQITGVRGDVAFAQAIHETGWFSSGCAIQKNNYSGWGATHPSECSTRTYENGGGYPFTAANGLSGPQRGVRTQLHQLRNYADSSLVQTWNPRSEFSRNDFGHKGESPTWAGLNCKWAYPRPLCEVAPQTHDYAQKIITTYDQILAYNGLQGYCSEAPPVAQQSQGSGYWVITEDGGVFTYGSAQFRGAGNKYIRNTVTAAFGNPSGTGYTMITNDGGVFTFGSEDHGAGNKWIKNTVVAAFGTRSGHGYTMVTNDGGVFTFGDAQDYGNGNKWIKNTVVAAFPSPSGGGYTMVTNDGGAFTFGDAQFAGAANKWVKNGIVSAAGTATGNGYWMVSTDGGMFALGDAGYFGGVNNCPGNTITDIERTGQTGYRVLTTTGKVVSFGNAKHFGPSNRSGNRSVAVIPVP